MVDPGRAMLEGVVEFDETEVPFQGSGDLIAVLGVPSLGKRLPTGH